MKKNNFKKNILVFFSVIIMMILLLVMEKSIPNFKVKENILKSETYYYDYFDYQFSNINILKGRHETVDVTGDLYHLGILYFEKNKNPWIEFIEMNKDSECSPKMINKTGFRTYKVDSDYSRYWNGHLIVLKPLLTFFNMSQIYKIYLVIFSIVFVILLLLMLKHSKSLAFIFTISAIIINVFFVTNCDSLIHVFLIAMISSIILIKMYEKNNQNIDLIFLINGMLAVYFDLITCETITLTLPLFIYIYLHMIDSKQIQNKEIIKFIILWLLGYVLTFGVKWLLLIIHYHGHFVEKVLEPMRERIYYEDKTVFNVFINNIRELPSYFYPFNYYRVKKIILILAIISFLILVIKDKKRRKCYIWLLLISLVPFVRYLVLSSHSDFHNYFTYRAFLTPLMFMFTCLFSLIYEWLSNYFNKINLIRR